MHTALIIDDERRAVNVLKILIEKHLPGLSSVCTCVGSDHALEVFDQCKPDLIFLDIEMPGMTGLELLAKLRALRPAIPVIFTTAYDQYAIRAIRFSAIDYLLKPIDIEELKSAYQRFVDADRTQSPKDFDQLLSNLMSNLKTINNQKPRLAVATQGGAVFFDINEIVRCEADNNYTVFHLIDGRKFVASQTLKEYDGLLNEYQFLRVHQSHLVNPSYINQYVQKGLLELKYGSSVPVARRKHHWLQKRLRELY